MSNVVVYEVETTRIVKECATERAAKMALTKLKKTATVELAYAGSYEFDNFIEKEVTRVNMMSGLEYKEKINTPSYCSPASESYWSM